MTTEQFNTAEHLQKKINILQDLKKVILSKNFPKLVYRPVEDKDYELLVDLEIWSIKDQIVDVISDRISVLIIDFKAL